jgi:predicted HNH restriction endonuclease
MSQSNRTKKWSAEATAHSDALDLEPHVFNKEDPAEIAESLKRSAESSKRRKSGAFRSAMSTLNLYINRAGRNLSPGQKRTLEAAKTKLRGLFGRET